MTTAVKSPTRIPGSAGEAKRSVDRYVGTIVGESTSREFRLAVKQEAVREQDIIAVDATLTSAEAHQEAFRIWAKVIRIERVNPLFPSEAGHELAETQTDPFDTVLSLSREMVSAVCQVLGTEPIEGDPEGKLGHLRYPAKPATSAYRPESADVKRIVLGTLEKRGERALSIARLANREEVEVKVDGDAIVRRHLAILAMTGAGKSWAARRIIEEIAQKHYPIVIFDPHGDYTGLAAVPALKNRVQLFRADLPIFDEDVDTAAQIVSGLSGEEMTPAQYDAFATLFAAVPSLFAKDNLSDGLLRDLLLKITKDQSIAKFGISRDLFGLAHLASAVNVLAKLKDKRSKQSEPTEEETLLIDAGLDAMEKIDAQQAGTFRVTSRQCRKAAF